MSHEDCRESNKMKEVSVLSDFDVFHATSDQISGDIDSTLEIDYSDDDKYEITTEDMISVYKRIAKNDFELSEKLVRVRSPSPEILEEQREDVKKVEDERMEKVMEEKATVEEFDFDSFTETSKIVTPRRIIGSIKTPRNAQKKRVAQWDKVMNDYLKYQKLEVKAKPMKTSPKLTTTNIPTPSVATTTPTTLVVKCLPINIISDIDHEFNSINNGIPAVAKVEVVSQSVLCDLEFTKPDNNDVNVIICNKNNE